MNEPDLIGRVESLAREVHDLASRHTRPALARYPLTFAFLLAFSLAAIVHGFELLTDSIPLFRENPLVLMGAGVLGLLITGSLYKSLTR